MTPVFLYEMVSYVRDDLCTKWLSIKSVNRGLLFFNLEKSLDTALHGNILNTSYWKGRYMYLCIITCNIYFKVSKVSSFLSLSIFFYSKFMSKISKTNLLDKENPISSVFNCFTVYHTSWQPHSLQVVL